MRAQGFLEGGLDGRGERWGAAALVLDPEKAGLSALVHSSKTRVPGRRFWNTLPGQGSWDSRDPHVVKPGCTEEWENQMNQLCLVADLISSSNEVSGLLKCIKILLSSPSTSLYRRLRVY